MAFISIFARLCNYVLSSFLMMLTAFIPGRPGVMLRLWWMYVELVRVVFWGY